MGVTQSPLCFGERTLVVPSDVDLKNEMGTLVKRDPGLLHKREENRAKSRRLVKSGLGDRNEELMGKMCMEILILSLEE